MTTYTTIPNGDIDQDSPVTQPLMTALRDNPLAGFEGSTDAPINQAAWHPYDAEFVGDGNDGVIYDFTVDGAVSVVETPDFSDGYEYGLILSGVSGNSGPDFIIDAYMESGATWLNLFTSTTSTAAYSYNGHAYVSFPRVPQNGFYLHGNLFHRAGGSSTADDINGGAAFSGGADVVQKLRFRVNVGTLDAGTVKLIRRREYITG